MNTNKPGITILLAGMMMLIAAAGSASPARGEPRDSSLLPAVYAFIDYAANAIDGPGHLDGFFQKLRQLERGEIDRVRIVHIGDSHIQADFFSGFLRRNLQMRFGNAGRGLVFPYRLADTNGPSDIRAGSSVSWAYRRNVYQRNGLPLGLAGMSISTQQPGFWLDLQLKPDSVSDQRFDKVTLFYGLAAQAQPLAIGYPAGDEEVKVAPPPRRYHVVRSGETLSGIAQRYRCSVRDLQRWNGLRGTLIRTGQRLAVGSGAPLQNYRPEAFAELARLTEVQGHGHGQSTFLLDTLLQRLLIRGLGQGSAGPATLYGLVLENARQNGVLYHAIGVNGATYYHYNEAEYFWEQLHALEADLVIVSLGTNDAAGSAFDSLAFQSEAGAFLDRLRVAAPGAAVIVTTNPDALRRRRYDNPNGGFAREALLAVASAAGAASWDLYGIMGGKGAIREWYRNGLAAADHIHFSRQGYELQGQLLFEALMQAYDPGN